MSSLKPRALKVARRKITLRIAKAINFLFGHK